MTTLSIYSAKTIGNQSRKYAMTINMDDLFNTRSIRVPASMDDINDHWNLWDMDHYVSDSCIERVDEWVKPLVSLSSDMEEYDDYLRRMIDDVLTMKVESALWQTIMNALDNVYCHLSDNDTGNPLVDSLENWYSAGSITFYMSQKQVTEYLRIHQLSMSDFDNDPDQVQDYIQEQIQGIESLDSYDFDSDYQQWIEPEDKHYIIEQLDRADEYNITLKGDKGEQLDMFDKVA